MLKAEISPVSLIHCLQTHDSFGYSVLDGKDEINKKFKYGSESLTGAEISNQLLEDMKNAKPYIRGTKSSMCSTYCGLLASRFGINNLNNISKGEKEKIKDGLILASMYCAMQPGIIMITGWDIVGSLPLSVNDKSIQKELKQGDYRWLNRGSYDLAGFDKNAKASAEGITKAKALFGPITEQLKDPNSYASTLKHILDVREKYQIPLSEMLDVPETGNPAVTIIINKLPNNKGYQVTALNFGDKTEKITIDLSKVQGVDISQFNNKPIIDILNNDQAVATISSKGILNITLLPITGKALLIKD